MGTDSNHEVTFPASGKALDILFLTQYFPPESNAPANRVYEFAKTWVEIGHRVQVLTGFPNHPRGVIHPGYRRKVFMREKMDGIEVMRTFTFAAANKGRIRRMVQFACFLVSAVVQGAFATKKCDLIVATSPQLLVALAGYLLSVLLRKPFVMEVRDIWPEAILAVGLMKPGPLITMLEKIERFLYRRAQAIVVVTEGFAEKIAAKGIPAEKIMVVPNAVDLRQFNVLEDKSEAKAEYDLGDKFLVSYVGTHGMAHNLSTVIEVAERLQNRADIHFLFVGDGAERERIKALAEEKGLRNVTLLGQQPRHLVPRFIGMSDVCLVPLRNTPLFHSTIPSKIYEIFACGVPLIIGVDGEARRLVEKARGGVFVEPESVDQMEASILRLYLSAQLRAELGDNGHSFVRREYDRQRIAGNYHNHLMKVCMASK